MLQAIVVFVPVPQMKAYQKIQTRLVRELEKKFSGRQVVFIAQRRILPKPTRKMSNKSKQKRPMRCVRRPARGVCGPVAAAWDVGPTS